MKVTIIPDYSFIDFEEEIILDTDVIVIFTFSKKQFEMIINDYNKVIKQFHYKVFDSSKGTYFIHDTPRDNIVIFCKNSQFELKTSQICFKTDIDINFNRRIYKISTEFKNDNKTIYLLSKIPRQLVNFQHLGYITLNPEHYQFISTQINSFIDVKVANKITLLLK